MQGILIIVLLRQVPHQAELPEAASFALEQWQQSSSLPELPEGATCDAEDKTRELKKLLMHTQQQLKESQVCQEERTAISGLSDMCYCRQGLIT